MSQRNLKSGQNPDLLDFLINLAGFFKCVEGAVLECKMFTKTQLVLKVNGMRTRHIGNQI